MNNIGFGIMCFGDDYFYQGTNDKINEILNFGFSCYVLTDTPNLIYNKYAKTIPYYKSYKSYHDKLILPKYILQDHDIAIVLDADVKIKDYSFLRDLKTFEFKPGISYIDTLLNHGAKKEFVKDFQLKEEQWGPYIKYAEQIYPNYGELETIWEYFMVVNNNGFNHYEFYNFYEKLQLTKDFSDLQFNKKVNGAGEGISTAISALLSQTSIQRDMDLYNLMKKYTDGDSRRHVPTHLTSKIR
jgi:hypothetical protein